MYLLLRDTIYVLICLILFSLTAHFIWKLMNTTIIKHLNFHFHMKNLTLALRDLQFKHLFTITLIGKFQQLTTTTTNQLFLLIVNGTATIQLLSVIGTLLVTGTLRFLVIIIRPLDL